MAETVPGYEATAWFGVGMPKNSPREAIMRINAVVNAALADPAVRAKLADLGGVPIPGTPEDFGRVIVMETEKWAKVVNCVRRKGGVSFYSFHTHGFVRVAGCTPRIHVGDPGPTRRRRSR